MRKRRRRAERSWKPWPSRSAEQPLVEETIGGEIRNTVLAQVERGQCDEDAHERFDGIEPAIVGNLQPETLERLVEPGLRSDRGGLAFVPGPAAERVAATIGDIERPSEIPLRCLRERSKLLDLAQQQRPSGRIPTPLPSPGSLQPTWLRFA